MRGDLGAPFKKAPVPGFGLTPRGESVVDGSWLVICSGKGIIATGSLFPTINLVGTSSPPIVTLVLSLVGEVSGTHINLNRGSLAT